MSGNVLNILLEKGLPTREVQAATAAETSDVMETQRYHDNLNLNANMQVDKEDVSNANPLPIQFPEKLRTSICMLSTQVNNLYITGYGYSPDGQEGRQIFTGSKYIVRIHIACKKGSNGDNFLYFMDTASPISKTFTHCVCTTFSPNKYSNETIECGFRVQNGLSVWGSGGGFYKMFELEGIWMFGNAETVFEGMCITVVVEE